MSTAAKIMVYRGHVENGVIRLDSAPSLPEGVEVEVRLITEDTTQEAEEEIPSLYERLKDVVGKVEEPPPDLAENHGRRFHARRRVAGSQLCARSL
jgi:hypothetical protein